MSTSDIMAIRNLLPDSEPDLLSLRPDENKKPFKFRDKADQAAALAAADLILHRLREEYGDDQAAVTEEFHEIVQDNERLRAAVNMAVCRQLCEEPRIQKLVAKQQRAKNKAKL